AADDTSRDRSGEAEWAAGEEQLVAHCRHAAPRLLPERIGSRRPGVQADHGEVVLRVLRSDLALPRLPRTAPGHAVARVLDDVVGRDHVRGVGAAPADEARAEALIRLDREDTGQHALREWRYPRIALFERPLGAANTGREGCVVELEGAEAPVQR